MDLIHTEKESSSNTSENRITKLLDTLTIVQKELNTIRKDLRYLNSCYLKDVDKVLNILKTWKCESCSSMSENQTEISTEPDVKNAISFKPIGVVSTSFAEKQGRRQRGICVKNQGKLTLFNTVFTNPSHALEGLEEFSHIWILFYFHKNDATYLGAKVVSPRSNELKIGVFATRSPHRPSPIGLSLVQIDYLEASSIYFSGVDMLDGTPVLDVKPYIPQYDNPLILTNQWNYEINRSNVLQGSQNELIDHSCIPREAPDGEEDDSEDRVSPATPNISTNVQIRVAHWITDSVVGNLTVSFKEKARLDLDEIKRHSVSSNDLNDKDLEACIVKVLEEDPRSVYVRERYSNQFYTFLIANYHVSCKFDDCNRSVQVYKVVKADSVTV